VPARIASRALGQLGGEFGNGLERDDVPLETDLAAQLGGVLSLVGAYIEDRIDGEVLEEAPQMHPLGKLVNFGRVDDHGAREPFCNTGELTLEADGHGFTPHIAPSSQDAADRAGPRGA
jgi:hypothetical protein